MIYPIMFTSLSLRRMMIQCVSNQRCLHKFDQPSESNLDNFQKTVSRQNLSSSSNITDSILNLINSYPRHLVPRHPISLVAQQVKDFFYNQYQKGDGRPEFCYVEHLDQIVERHQAFELLDFDKNHPSRNPSDTYFIDSNRTLRGHTTVHYHDLISSGLDSFLAVGNCYRRDTIDKLHYPVFTQMDGARIQNEFELSDNLNKREKIDILKNSKSVYNEKAVYLMENDLKNSLNLLVSSVLGLGYKTRWVPSFFPFTDPSWEMEILPPEKNDKEENWVELLGCGILNQSILKRAGCGGSICWAFGIGLDRLAMLKYSIEDIRMLWSTEERFFKQFEKSGKICFKPLSVQPPLKNDISFWLDSTVEFCDNDFYDLLRDVADENVVEDVKIIDIFKESKPKSNIRVSRCYRVTYRHAEKPLSNKDVMRFNEELKSKLQQLYNAEIR